MKKLLFQLIILIGALSNAIVMTMIGASTILIISTTIAYIVIFELLILFLEPRLALAERKRNLTKYPFLRELINANKATVTLVTGEKIYNATFAGYINEKDAKTIKLNITTPKTKKEPEKVCGRDILLTQIKEVKKIA
ncbi:response regulator [Solibacillus sp. CAU 1738]|uniref:response regulator n=1 Tax=Solibacillus sp. CAU 1738 TaxID=3140363 RepID=UPI003261A471